MRNAFISVFFVAVDNLSMFLRFFTDDSYVASMLKLCALYGDVKLRLDIRKVFSKW